MVGGAVISAMGRCGMRQRLFTQLLVDRCSPAEVQGIDPSEGQLAFARSRVSANVARFRAGNAMVFVPEPAKGVAEMEVRSIAPLLGWWAFQLPSSPRGSSDVGFRLSFLDLLSTPAV